MRPKSIVRFEQLFFASLILSALGTALTWGKRMELYHAQPGSEMIGDAFPIAMLVIGYLIYLALWYFIARKASNVAKWIYIVLIALAVLGLVMSLVMRTVVQDPLTTAQEIVCLVLEFAAIWFLFQPDALAWFSGEPPAADAAEPFA